MLHWRKLGQELSKNFYSNLVLKDSDQEEIHFNLLSNNAHLLLLSDAIQVSIFMTVINGCFTRLTKHTTITETL